MKTFGAVVAGYLAMAFVVFGALAIAFLAVGPDRAFLQGSWDVSMLWIGIWLVVSLAAAYLGGSLSRKIGGSALAPKILLGLVLVLGLVSAVLTMGMPGAEGPRSDQLDAISAMRKAKSPTWVLFANPILGAIGIFLGGLRARTTVGADAAGK